MPLEGGKPQPAWRGVRRARLRNSCAAVLSARSLFWQQPTKILTPPVLARVHRFGETVDEKLDIPRTVASAF